MTPEAVLESIEAAAPKRGLPIIGPKRGVFLDEAVGEHHPNSILEVGTLVGYSAIRMGRHLKPSQKVTCIEVKEEMVEEARSNIKKAGLSDRIEVLHGDAKKVIPTLKGPFDMVYLDAVKEDYLAYLNLCERFLHTGSVVVADNVKAFANEMADYLDYVRNSGRFKSAYREAPSNWGKDEGDAIEVSIRL